MRAASPHDPNSQLRTYFVMPPTFDAGPVDPSESDIDKIGSREMLSRAIESTKERYQVALDEAVHGLGVVIHTHERPDLNTMQFVIAFRRDSTHSYFSAVSDVLNHYGIHSRRKFIEHFNNGFVLFSIHVDATIPRPILDQMREDLSLVYVLPRTGLTPLFRRGKLSAQEVVYAYAVWKFAHQFMVRYSREYQLLAPAFADDPFRLGLLSQFKRRLSKDAFTEARIFETIVRHLELVKDLFADFARLHFVAPEHKPAPTIAPMAPPWNRASAKTSPRRWSNRFSLTFLAFNRHILKTNFYRDRKTALAFRIDPAFLPQDEYPATPHGIFFLLGSEFRGFHVRFRDVARGGVRIIRSADRQSFIKNCDMLFDEVYQLAHTQQSKNKDIPSGGSKGAILLSLEHQAKPSMAFKKYVDSLLDVLLPNDEIADHLGQQEILFLGPDEGTADLMDWAATFARERGYPYWKAFTTGKSVRLGGIPHDVYGMTTRSVHQYVLGILRELGIDESTVSKIQTGGPDGDLGSNEIKVSRDRTVAVVDGGGVLCDPDGLNRTELLRLATARQTIRKFDRAQLGPQGFLVTVDDRDVMLPNGARIANGLLFRNSFHLHELARADLFVPCGGRPEAVHINNVSQMLDERGNPHFRFIVEGANLFFTQPARRELEKAGVILFKDASTNKGGVISSSLEVLAALALDDEEFNEHMEVHGSVVPQFYSAYTEQVLEGIERCADLEFSCLWRAHERTGIPLCDLTDQLGAKITRIHDDIAKSRLVELPQLRRRVVEEACPPALLQLLGMDRIMERLPPNYLTALIAAHLASRYVYRFGLDASELDFLAFLDPYTR